MKDHNYRIELERLIAVGILGNLHGETDRVTLSHRTKRGPGGFDTSALSETIARELNTSIITVAHDAKCRALKRKGKFCNCRPDIIINGKIVNRGLYEQIHTN